MAKKTTKTTKKPKKTGEKKPMGRPTKMTPEVLEKLEHGFKIGLNDTECCCYADINLDDLYYYQRKNPEFSNKKVKWKQNPIAKAKNTIYKNLDDPKTAQWYLERKCKDEFSTAQKVDLNATGINIVVADNKHKDMLEEL